MTDFIITGTADEILELCAGPRQHNAHCMGWRWHLYMQQAARAEAAMREEGRKIIARAHALREARETWREAAE